MVIFMESTYQDIEVYQGLQVYEEDVYNEDNQYEYSQISFR